MAITRFRNSSILNRGPKYNDFLAGLPFRPIIGTATDGGTGTTVSVAFTGNNPAGAGITYTALSSPGNLTATGPASPITVSGLTAGTAYTFQVKAGNSLGDSAYSSASNSVTPVTPTAFESIATASGTGSSNTITFSSIPGTYQHLQIRIFASSDYGSASRSLFVRLNGDTGSNYVRHKLNGDGSAATASAQTSQTSAGNLTVAGGADSNILSPAIIDIHDYASTTKNKTLRMFSGFDNNSSSGRINLDSGLWLNTSAVTSLSIFLADGNWTTTSTFALYGIKS